MLRLRVELREGVAMLDRAHRRRHLNAPWLEHFGSWKASTEWLFEGRSERWDVFLA